MSAKIAYGFSKERSTVSSICSLSCEKVKETGVLNYKSKHEKPKTVRTLESIAAVAEIVCEVISISSVVLNN